MSLCGPSLPVDEEMRKPILSQEPLGGQWGWGWGACTYPPFPVYSLCCFGPLGLQFTLQSLVISPLHVCPTDLNAWCPQDRETVTKKMPHSALVSPGCWQAWPGPPIATHLVPFHFQASRQIHKPLQKATSAYGSLRPLMAARCGLTYILKEPRD